MNPVLSDRVRQNAASLLAKDLQLDWRMGAEWFQWCLADHDVKRATTRKHSRALGGPAMRRSPSWPRSLATVPPPNHWQVSANFGNWAYFSGVGSDPKHRQFKTVSQAAKYDPTGQYVRTWLPELAGVADVEAVLRPYAHAVEGWPEPLVDPSSQLTWQDAAAVEETGRVVREGQET